MNITFYLGVIGSLVLVLGAAWPEPKRAVHPTSSMKNWLFVVGNAAMFAYAYTGFLQGGSIFFVMLEILVIISTLLMMLNVPDSIDTPILTISGAALVVWSLYLFSGYHTIIFVFGLTGVALGYALEMGSVRRGVALTLGSILLAAFSYIESSWIFFWLNVFFALFSAYYLVKLHISRR